MPHAPTRLARRIGAELAAFGVIGAVCLVSDILLFNLLAFGLDLPLLVAKCIGMIITGTMAFLGHRHVTFRHREPASRSREVPMFVLVTLVTVALSLLPLYVVRHMAGATSPFWLNVANLSGIALGTIARYVAYRTMVWSDVRLPDATASGSRASLADERAARDDARNRGVLEVKYELVGE